MKSRHGDTPIDEEAGSGIITGKIRRIHLAGVIAAFTFSDDKYPSVPNYPCEFPGLSADILKETHRPHMAVFLSVLMGAFFMGAWWFSSRDESGREVPAEEGWCCLG